MKIVMLVLAGVFGSSINFVGQSSNQPILPAGVYVQSFEFRPLFKVGEQEAEWNPTNPFDPKPREGTIGSRPMPGGDPSMEQLRREPQQERHGFEVYLQLKNSSPRVIKKLDWDFLFLDSESGDELKRFSITSKSKIRSGEVKFLTKQVLPGLFLGGRTKPEFARGKAAVVIRSIEFADGSKWQGALRKP
jgi:hypothetical protein